MGFLNWVWAPAAPGGPQMTMVADAVQGISWATAFDFNDVVLAIAANGWIGVPWTESCGVPARQFCSGIRLQIGDGVTPTYFWDQSFQTIFLNGITTANYQPLYYVSATGLSQFGVVVDAVRRTTEGGGMFLDLDVTRFQTMLSGAVGATMHAYSYLHVSRTSIDRSTIRNGNAYNCTFQPRTWGTSIHPVDMDLYNITVTSGFEGLSTPENCTMDDIKILTSPCRFVIAGGGAIDLRNSTMRACTKQLDSRWNNAYFTNCIDDNWALLNWFGVAAGITRRRVDFNLTVRDRVTGALLNGVANLYDNVGVLIFSVPIVAGVIATQTVNTYWISQAMGVNWQPYGPFHLQILVPGYQTYDDYNFPLDNQLAGPIYEDIGLVRIVDLIFVDDKVALNLDEDNPESEMFTQL